LGKVAPPPGGCLAGVSRAARRQGGNATVGGRILIGNLSVERETP
jgi:hypothetical protein